MMFLIILSLIVVLGLFFVYFFPQFYVCELIISFLPYIVFFSLFVAGIFVLLLIKNKGAKRKYYIVLSLLFSVAFFLYTFQYNGFYTGEGFQTSVKTEKTGGNNGLNILYSNILYKTKNYDELNSRILDADADLVMMVEFTEDFGQNMSEAVLEKYPYSARVEYSDKYYGNVVFSKYPIKNLTQEIEWGTWRYAYFSLNYGDRDYYIYLVHTAAPVSLAYFRMRNNQLKELADDFGINKSKMSENDRVLVLGDFNLSPWSLSYEKLKSKLQGMIDLTSKYTVLFTWRYRYLPVIASHIDHVFVDEGASVDSMTIVDTPESDHYGFFIKNLR